MVLIYIYQLNRPLALFRQICKAMGSDSNPSKHHYDITMSNRTRRSSKLQDANQDCSIMYSPRNDTFSPWKAVVNEGDESSPLRPDEAREDDCGKSLKQLIKPRIPSANTSPKKSSFY